MIIGQSIGFFIKEEAKKLGINLSDQMVGQHEVYLRELKKWNQKMNLTGHREEMSILADLFLDSLAFHKGGNETLYGSVLDVGTGAGFPGLPLKISKPDLSITLMEPNLKRVSFLHHIIGTLGLKDVQITTKRLDDFTRLRLNKSEFDFIIFKALRFQNCLPYVKPLLKKGGKVIFSRSLKKAVPLEVSGLSVQKEWVYELPGGCGKRVLTVLCSNN